MTSIIDDYRKMFTADIAAINSDCGGDFLTVQEYLNLKSMSEAQIIAGMTGLENKCTHIAIWETPEGLDWLIGGEFIMTAGYAVKDSYDIKDTLIDKIYEHGCSGIAIKENRYFGEVPQTMIDRANQLGVPLIILPKSMVYTEVISSFYDALFYKSNSYLLEMKKTHEQLLDLIFDQKDVKGVLETLGILSNASIVLVGPDRIVHQTYFYNEIDGSLQKESDLHGIFSADSYYQVKIPVLFDSSQKGFLYAFSMKDFNNLCRHALNHGAKIIGMKIKRDDIEIYNEIRIKKMITEIIIQDKNLTNDFLKNVKTNIKWDDNSPSYGIGLKFYTLNNKPIDFEQLQKEVYTLVGRVCDNFTYLLSEADDIILLYINRISNEKLAEFIELLKFKFIINNKWVTLSINLSRSFNEVSCLSRIQDECVITAYMNKPGEVLSYESLGTIKLLSSLKYDPRVIQQYNEIMDKIESYDRQNEGVLIDTLDTFFENNMNKKDTSESLHIHVETLRYRLNKIESLTGCSTSSSEGLFILQLMSKLKKIIT